MNSLNIIGLSKTHNTPQRPRLTWRLLVLCLLAALGAPSLAAEDEPPIEKFDEDERLEKLIEMRLAWDKELAAYDLSVDVTDAVVTLKGAVADVTESHRARRIADVARGAGGIVNAIRVDSALVPFKESQIEQPDDETLRKRVVRSLETDPDVRTEDIEVTVEDGYVTLSGHVVNIADGIRAERIARSLFGVSGVTANLDLREP